MTFKINGFYSQVPLSCMMEISNNKKKDEYKKGDVKILHFANMLFRTMHGYKPSCRMIEHR